MDRRNMESVRRRTFLGSSLAAGSTLTAGCLGGPIGGQDPQANHWAAGIQWSAARGKVSEVRGFLSKYGNINHPSSIRDYLRVNGGELHRMSSSSSRGNLSLPAGRGDHIEYFVDLDSPSDMRKKVFEYTIPDDDDLIAAVAGFAECLLYEDADGWVTRPYNAAVGKDILRRPEETLRVTVIPEDNVRYNYFWGHSSSIREELRKLAEESETEIKQLKFVQADESTIIRPTNYRSVSMRIFDATDSTELIPSNSVSSISFRQPNIDGDNP